MLALLIKFSYFAYLLGNKTEYLTLQVTGEGDILEKVTAKFQFFEIDSITHNVSLIYKEKPTIFLIWVFQ